MTDRRRTLVALDPRGQHRLGERHVATGVQHGTVDRAVDAEPERRRSTAEAGQPIGTHVGHLGIGQHVLCEPGVGRQRHDGEHTVADECVRQTLGDGQIAHVVVAALEVDGARQLVVLVGLLESGGRSLAHALAVEEAGQRLGDQATDQNRVVGDALSGRQSRRRHLERASAGRHDRLGRVVVAGVQAVGSSGDCRNRRRVRVHLHRCVGVGVVVAGFGRRLGLRRGRRFRGGGGRLHGIRRASGRLLTVLYIWHLAAGEIEREHRRWHLARFFDTEEFGRTRGRHGFDRVGLDQDLHRCCGVCRAAAVCQRGPRLPARACAGHDREHHEKDAGTAGAMVGTAHDVSIG